MANVRNTVASTLLFPKRVAEAETTEQKKNTNSRHATNMMSIAINLNEEAAKKCTNRYYKQQYNQLNAGTKHTLDGSVYTCAKN